MSDSVQNPDIEDVLSSIRRLVSHDGGRTGEADMADTDTDAAQSKLVLTPALRVETEDDAAGAAAPSEDESSNAEVLDLISPDVPLAFTSARAAKQKADDEDQKALILEDPVDVVEEVAAEAEHAPAEDAADKVFPDTSPETSVETSVETETAEIEPVHAEAVSVEPTAHESLTAKIAALEEVIGREPDQWEPESEGLGDNAGTDVDALPWEDHVEAENKPVDADAGQTPEQPSPEPVTATVEDADVDPDTDLSDMGETILDEAMLRDLVSNIVREELQGALGERITRNVRKLVRREIHRAMSAQDFN